MRRKWTIGRGYPDGWCVTVETDGTSERRYYAASGGEWELTSSGDRGAQIAGRLDVRAPSDERRFRRWVRARFAR